MANITAADVNKLRQTTGAGMMDCKNALVEADGDFDAAIDILRKKGQKLADKRADREANEGYVIAKVNADKSFGAVMILNCETDFVAKNEEFATFANNVAELAVANKITSLEDLNNLDFNGRTVQENVTDMIGKIGEKIQFARYATIESPMVFAYNHHGNKLATLLGLNKSDEAFAQAGKEVNMQVAAMNPVALDKEDVDPQIVEKEIEIGKDIARQEGKPEELVEKIAIGKLNRFYKENTLVNQDFVRDNKMTVGQFITSVNKDLKITGFQRVSLT